MYNSAAAVAASDAHKALGAAFQARSAEADARVARMIRQNPNMIDLHGVSTADAKRIALDRTRVWWEGLGEHRHELMNGQGWKLRNSSDFSWFVIVVGKGTHSAGQRGVLGPAVIKALEQEGWKLEDEISLAGRVVVKGKRKKNK